MRRRTISNIKKPPIPPLTCNHIDRIIELVDSMSNLAKDADCDQQMIEMFRDVVRAECELVREANDQLRSSSKYWYDRRKGSR